MKRLVTENKYLTGVVIGICGEYLYRVDSDVWYYPAMIIALLLIVAIIDIAR